MTAPLGGLFTNDWVNFVISNYSGFFTIILPMVLLAIVKLLAIFDPDIPSGKMVDWIQGTFYTGTAETKKEVTTTEVSNGAVKTDSVVTSHTETVPDEPKK